MMVHYRKFDGSFACGKEGGLSTTFWDRVTCLECKATHSVQADESNHRADENACQKAVDQMKLQLGSPRH
jgi:hypothetical protein